MEKKKRIYATFGIIIIIVLLVPVVFSQAAATTVHSCLQSLANLLNPLESNHMSVTQGYKYGASGGIDLNSSFDMSGTQVPYQIVSPNPIKNSLVTFSLPKGFSSKFVTVFWVNNGTASYVFNETNKLVLYSHSKFLGEKEWKYTEKIGSDTIQYSNIFRVYKVKLPGNYYDPTVWAYQGIAFYNMLHQLIGNVTAKGYINYVLGGTVTDINAQESSAVAYNGYILCGHQTVANGVGSTVGYIQELASATICFLFASHWWDAWPGWAVDSLSGQVYYTPAPIGNTGTSPACLCTQYR